MPGLSPHAVRNLPEYRELLRRRRAISLPLTVIVLIAYYSFIVLVAYAPEFLAQPVGDSIATYGIAYGLGLILLTFLVTAIYVRYANRHIEHLVHIIQQKAVSHE